ncbi:hypothetical protein UA08_00741 [Talaromyces atroroseus]|uniref:Uncharacterized protein n=1 Tax=Talaromyces atroroseus TaxID=1441469 RepID=A0A225ARW0_TALAT|nr:hypothetical protein UA08_00741 [Talaromyces atroroseus]OKL64321.1 hypothetical protein UA08_00741 [Talaromyces atroroseus]
MTVQCSYTSLRVGNSGGALILASLTDDESMGQKLLHEFAALNFGTGRNRYES